MLKRTLTIPHPTPHRCPTRSRCLRYWDWTEEEDKWNDVTCTSHARCICEWTDGSGTSDDGFDDFSYDEEARDGDDDQWDEHGCTEDRMWDAWIQHEHV